MQLLLPSTFQVYETLSRPVLQSSLSICCIPSRRCLNPTKLRLRVHRVDMSTWSESNSVLASSNKGITTSSYSDALVPSRDALCYYQGVCRRASVENSKSELLGGRVVGGVRWFIKEDFRQIQFEHTSKLNRFSKDFISGLCFRNVWKFGLKEARHKSAIGLGSGLDSACAEHAPLGLTDVRRKRKDGQSWFLTVAPCSRSYSKDQVDPSTWFLEYGICAFQK